MRKPWKGAAILVLLATLAGCDAQQTLKELSNRPGRATPASIRSAPPADVRPGETITVASFNIQVFGVSKLKKREVVDVLAKVVRRFDVVAIQELRSKDRTVMQRFVDRINADGARYDYVVGPRLGRTSSKEQYAFVYNTARIAVDVPSIHTPPDPGDRLHREPLVARFRVVGLPEDKAFSFNLVNIHTDPDETDTELDALDDVFLAVQKRTGLDDDVILLGDLNVDERHLGQLGRVPGITWVVSGTTTNTRRNKSYDNILFDRRATSEYTGRWGVLDLQVEYGLTKKQALAVSDHLPVWAEFRVEETVSMASRKAAAR